MISDWVKQQELIELIGKGSNIRNFQTVQICRLPELEQKLFVQFFEQQKQDYGIWLRWLRVNAM